jgi:hypothetical protein
VEQEVRYWVLQFMSLSFHLAALFVALAAGRLAATADEDDIQSVNHVVIVAGVSVFLFLIAQLLRGIA